MFITVITTYIFYLKVMCERLASYCPDFIDYEVGWLPPTLSHHIGVCGTGQRKTMDGSLE